MGYANSLLRLSYPDLAEDGDDVYVVIRNPRTLSAKALNPGEVATVRETLPDGRVVEKPADPAAAETATYALIARLVRDWHVYDADDDAGGPLPLPATAESVAKLPLEILMDISARLEEVTNPR